MRTKEIKYLEHRCPEPLKHVKVLRHNVPNGDFFVLTRGGTYRVWDRSEKYQEVAKFGHMLYLPDHRLFSFLIELENDERNSLGCTEQQTTVAFPIH